MTQKATRFFPAVYITIITATSYQVADFSGRHTQQPIGDLKPCLSRNNQTYSLTTQAILVRVALYAN
jgi:hypothetical protein